MYFLRRSTTEPLFCSLETPQSDRSYYIEVVLKFNAPIERIIFLTLFTAKAKRLLHTAPSALGGTSVSAFTPSTLRDNLQWVCHSPVIPILRGFGIIFFQLEPTPPSSVRSLIR
jgi:hypothetical protein